MTRQVDGEGSGAEERVPEEKQEEEEDDEEEDDDDDEENDDTEAGPAAEDIDGGQVFDFDDDTTGVPSSHVTKPDRPKPKVRVPKRDSASLTEPTGTRVSTLSTSPAVAIVPTTSPLTPASMGSYRGRAITTFDVVRDRRIHDKAAELGDFNSFVGSVDGRSGVDGGDLNSFRASLSRAQYSGTPRSFSERMAFEEAQSPP